MQGRISRAGRREDVTSAPDKSTKNLSQWEKDTAQLRNNVQVLVQNLAIVSFQNNSKEWIFSRSTHEDKNALTACPSNVEEQSIFKEMEFLFFNAA